MNNVSMYVGWKILAGRRLGTPLQEIVDTSIYLVSGKLNVPTPFSILPISLASRYHIFLQSFSIPNRNILIKVIYCPETD